MFIFVILWVSLVISGFVVIVVKNIVDVIKFFWKLVFNKKVLIFCFVLFVGVDLNVLDNDLIIGKIMLFVCVVLFGMVGDKIKLLKSSE